MKKIIDLIAPSGTGKDQRLLNYVREKYILPNHVTNVCFICGEGDDYEHHTQISASQLRELVFKINSKNTIYFFFHFFIDIDKNEYLKILEEMCENDIQIFKTDQIEEHVTEDKEWQEKYCQFITLDDLNS